MILVSKTKIMRADYFIMFQGQVLVFVFSLTRVGANFGSGCFCLLPIYLSLPVVMFL